MFHNSIRLLSVVNLSLFCVLGTKYTIDNWLKSPYSSYEYAVVYRENINMATARSVCQFWNGELAYAGLFETKAWE